MEFQYECFKHNVYLNYLPPHASHVLQPLDLGVFSSVKGRYCAGIRDITLINDANNVKKHHFIKIYENTRKYALTPRTIKSGWKATGIMPYCPEKALNSSQLRIQPQATSLPPSHTPKQLKIDPNILYLTPKSQKDILFLYNIWIHSKNSIVKAVYSL